MRSVPLLVLLSSACTSPPAPKEPSTVAPRPRKARPTMAMQSSVGALDQAAVERSFGKLFGAIERCITEGDARIRGIGGAFTVELRIKPDGSPRWAYLSSSTLGDREAERCILEAAREKRWPQPVGGEGEASHTFEVEGAEEVHEWGETRLRPVMNEIRRQLHRCLEEAPGAFSATLYVQRNGRVAAAGVAPPDADGEAKSDCVADVLRTFRFGPQPREMTKVTFVIGG